MDPIDPSLKDPAPSRGPLFYIGAGGLLALMFIETLSVIGRHIGLPLLGALEIIQAAILLAACASMVIATLMQAHASVHLLVDRVPPRIKQALLRSAALLAALFFVALAIGSFWLTVEFWHAHEQTEMLGISYRPLRIVTTLSCVTVAALFAYRSLRSQK